MTDGRNEPGGSPAPDQGSRLAQRLVAAPHAQQEQQGEDPSPRRSTSGLRVLLIRIGYWSATVLAALGALVLMAAAGAISAQHRAGLQEQAQDGFDAQDRITAARQDVGGLPDRAEAQRWLLQATTAGESVAAAQNTYLEHSGPINVDDLPARTPGLGERDECTPYVGDPPITTREYTEEEHTTCAEGLRESAVGGLERKLTPHFAAGARDSEGFSAVSPWHLSVATFDEDASLAGYTWTAHRARVFEEDTAIRMVWILVEDETGRTAAWLRGEYDPVVKKFDDLVLGTVAGVEDDEDDEDGDEDDTDDPVEDNGEDVQGDEPEGGE
ncbi:hypothetical protein PWG71_21430 [Nocardiopsis sp. N85]|uniref:hypothetical protein n=1 Tax=Nocardiopsis sp. N85 TaxID=3029400 RepID=UPI00237EEF69|nr:hypothetical protein [Nocardiopsis sp. N85]MDE3723960.1 hypothetical protein [Nocardiopsis sp. N85]